MREGRLCHHISNHFFQITLALSLALIMVACGGPKSPDHLKQQPPSHKQAVDQGQIPPPAKTPETRDTTEFKNYVETGDLKALRKRGTIRFVSITLYEQEQLYRSNTIDTQLHHQLADNLARRLKLKPVWVRTNSAAKAIELLQQGYGDVIADNLSATKARGEIINFTAPIEHIHQQLLTGPNGPDISDVANLHDVKFLVIAGSTHVNAAKEIIEKHPDANLALEELHLDNKLGGLVDRILKDPHAVTILDSNTIEGLRQYRDDLRVGASVSESQDIVWGVRKNSSNLLARIDNFLTRSLVKPVNQRIADWPEIKKSGVLRLLTYNGPTGYFLWKGVLMGFDFELAKAFAEKHRLQLQVVAVPFDKSLVQWLKEGRGDIAGAFSTFTPERKAQGVAFTVPYAEMAEKILSNSDKPPIETPLDLKGRTITLRAFSPFSASAHALKETGLGVKVVVAPPDVSYLQLIAMVASGELDATIMDASTAEIEASVRPELLAGMQTADPRPKGWMLLPQNWQLLKEVNKFIKQYRKSDKYQNLVKIYLKPDRRHLQRMEARIIPGADLSPFDALVKDYATRYQFDWRLVTAQMWQESSFNPRAVSPVGAQGLLQVMPNTAKDMGIPPPLFEPERGIRAGVKYLRWVRNRFPAGTKLDEKLWFTLASYNAGLGHLLDAQVLARELGLDPNKWFGNVEVAMLKLSEPQYFKKARYGYVRGAEPVQYVRNISNLYKAYTDVATGEVTVRPPLRPPPAVIRYPAATGTSRPSDSVP
ncbi:transporter substrate-binding domain-containing protein [Microbulbifer hainanensis]|uniref:transporter substrate-binding domain-containing protein n=1 Tax=Microbulbifer hainanensis TaxID=2735675 RepID=UPI001868B979|nr:transporter substrate-binding domain-containing protein [Microbulbifer hainanensis]